MRYLTKTDLGKKIYGLEQYSPGAESTKQLTLKTTSGTSTGTPTVIVFKYLSDPRVLERYYHPYGARNLRLADSNSGCLSAVHYALRYSDMQQMLVLEKSDLSEPLISDLVSQFKPMSIRGTASYVNMFLDKLRSEKKESSLKDVSCLSLSGEITTLAQWEKFVRYMPNAIYVNTYGLAETDVFNVYCAKADARIVDYPLRTFCIFADTHDVEILHPDTEGIGEIVLSTPEYQKYRTGDLGKLITEQCECGCVRTLIVEGRKDFDVVYCVGATITLFAVEQVFTKLSSLIADYRVEVRELMRDTTTFGHLTLVIVPTEQGSKDTNLKEKIRIQIEGTLQCTPTRTVADLVRDEVFLPSEVTISPPFPLTTKKVRLQKVA